MTRAEILLTINSNLEGIRKANEEFLRLRQQTRATSSELQNFSRSMMSGLGIGAGFSVGAKAADVLLGTVRNVSAAIKDTIVDGVRFNATLETSALGVASVLRQFNPEKYRDFGAAMLASGQIIDQLKKKALETAATFEELLIAFQGSAGAMASAGIPLSKQVDLIVNISQAMAALGIRTEEMRQEATALMMGNIDRNARLAQTLGITSEQVKTAREQGRLYEFITEKLGAFSEAAKVAGFSINVLESNLNDAKTQAAAEATEGLSLAYKMLLATLTQLTQSPAYKATVGFISDLAGLATLKLSMMLGGLGTSKGAAPPTNSPSDAAEAQAAAQRAEAQRLAKESAEAREKGAKEYAQMQERNRAAIRASAKASDPALYLQLLNTDKGQLENSLRDPKANREFYLKGIDNPTAAQSEDARKAASAYRLEISAKIAGIEKEIAATTAEQARKAKNDQEDRQQAEVRFLKVKSETGTLDEKITALNAEKAALDKTSLNYAAEALAIEMRIAKLKDDAAARIRSEQQRAAQRAQEAAVQQIRDNRFITERTKQQLLYNAFKQEEANIAEKIAAAQALVSSQPEGSATKAQAQQELDGLLQRRDVGIPHDLAENKPLTAMEDMQAGLVSLVDSFQSIGSLISDSIGSALNSISGNLTGLIMQTQTWGQALRNIAATILTSVISAIVQASVQWVARKIIEFALGNSLRAAALAANLGTAMALAQIWATPAALATIATFGGAAVAAPVEIAGAMGAVHSMALFAKGGYTGPGGVLEVAGLAHKGEVIFNQSDVARHGGVEAVENLRVRGGGYMDNGAVTSAVTSAPVEANGGDGPVVNHAFFNSQQDAEQWLYSQRGRRVMTDFVKGVQYELA